MGPSIKYVCSKGEGGGPAESVLTRMGEGGGSALSVHTPRRSFVTK